MATFTPMIQQYLTIKADYPDAFLFFRLGDFYEMFFEDAEKAAQILEITLTSREGGGATRIPMCGVPYHSADSYIHKLIESGYKVAICEQVEDPKQAKGVVKREVTKVITPGTIMEGKVLQHKGNNYIASMYPEIDSSIFGLTIGDLSTGEFYTTRIYGNVEEIIMELNQFQPAEVLIEENWLQAHKENITPYIDSVLSSYATGDEIALKTFTSLFQDQFGEQEDIPLICRLSSGVLLNYLQKTQQRKITHFNQVQYYDTKQFMILDSFTRKNLELTQTARDQSKKGSLLWLLDQSQTAMGSRLLRRWLEKPLLIKSEIEERLDQVEELYHNPLLTEELKKSLKQVYDIERLVSKIAFGNATPKDLYALRRSLERVPEIFNNINESNTLALKKLVQGIDFCDDVQALISDSINEDPPATFKDGGIIKRGFNPQLDQYYRVQSEGKLWLQELEKRERELTGIKSLKVGFNKVFGYYIEVTRTNLNQVPQHRYIRKQTLANAERYITEELKEKESQILEADEKTLDLEYEVFVNIREKIAEHAVRLQGLAKQIAALDVLLAFATVSIQQHYTRPRTNLDGKLQIKDGRHPVIEAVQKGKPYIANDVNLNNEEEQILLITGPNMSGKSTYMRQIALSVIMAQIGCFVPAKSADITITDRIFTRIGAGDDLTSGYSTFMVEMMETKLAITQATSQSLILLDEIGRGTSTYDGMALAQAIVQHIHEVVKAKTLFSTHYHELTDLEHQFKRIHNIHVNVIEKDGNVVFLHKIEKGKADKSYGIHVAELAGLPDEVIKNAKQILSALESNEDEIAVAHQLDLFQVEAAVTSTTSIPMIEQIKELDLLNMTPMEAFQILYELQKELRK